MGGRVVVSTVAAEPQLRARRVRQDPQLLDGLPVRFALFEKRVRRSANNCEELAGQRRLPDLLRQSIHHWRRQHRIEPARWSANDPADRANSAGWTCRAERRLLRSHLVRPAGQPVGQYGTELPPWSG